MTALQHIERSSHAIARSCACHLLSLLPPESLRWLRVRGVIKDILDDLSINCVLDVGANRGQFGKLLRDVGYRGAIVSFEPVQANLEALRSIARERGPWKVVPCALGSQDAEAEIGVTRGSVFCSFLTPTVESQAIFPDNSVLTREMVPVRRLDSILGEYIADIPAPRLFLKLDTQGFDLEVLKGAEAFLPYTLGLQTEISFLGIYHDMPHFTETIAACEARGFEVADFNPVSRRQDRPAAIEMDCIMVRKPPA